MKKRLLTNSKSGGGITKLNSNAFTLIELLAIIVILAIIAVITVPIILNIIENSKKGAAIDSAYGYKDAVNKWYVTKLQEDNQFQLADSYTISSDGKLGDIVIPISGDKPSGGYLNYSNNTLTAGCLVIGDYAVTFDGGNATSTIKGDCSSSSNNSGNETSGDTNNVVEIWDRYYYYDSVNDTTANTTEFDDSWIVWGQENDTNGRREVCGKYTINENNYISCLRYVNYEEFINSVTVVEDNYSINEGTYISIKNAEFINNGLYLGGLDDDGPRYFYDNYDIDYHVSFFVNEHNDYSEVEIWNEMQSMSCNIGNLNYIGFNCYYNSY